MCNIKPGWRVRPGPRMRWTAIAFTAVVGIAAGGEIALDASALPDRSPGPRVDTPYVVIGYNDLGMHCMNGDFSELIILPPFNTLHAQLIRRGTSPDIERSAGDFQIRYWTPGNTHSADKTNYWAFQPPEFGAPRPPDVGLTGSKLSGTMTPTPSGDWSVTGIPIVPMDDSGVENPYPLASIEVTRRDSGVVVARTQAVVPVSSEISCNLCHNTPGMSPEHDILLAHDRLHGTSLVNQKPVLCAGCHGSAALGLPGQPELRQMSTAMHASHASRMDAISLPEKCYACHPGVRTQCQRDLHFAAGVGCTQCHGDMAAVGSPKRQPWIDEPRCSDCHVRQGFQFEQPGTLYRNSVGHGGVKCAACHGSPHAMGPAVTETDNVQANLLQGRAGVIDDCTVCHGASGPPGQFFHSQDD